MPAKKLAMNKAAIQSKKDGFDVKMSFLLAKINSRESFASTKSAKINVRENVPEKARETS